MYFLEKDLRRESLRLKRYDYRQSGYYYVTLCTQNRICLFGEIRHAELVLSEAGRMIRSVWLEIPEKYFGFEIDSFVVMPNHLHGILIKTQPPLGAGPTQGSAPTLSLSDMIRYFKMFTTSSYLKGVKDDRFIAFENKLWQRNYYEHIVRDEGDLNRIRQYIIDNPAKWDEDKENPLWLSKGGSTRGSTPTKASVVGADPCVGPGSRIGTSGK